jgi:hypothetical protein
MDNALFTSDVIYIAAADSAECRYGVSLRWKRLEQGRRYLEGLGYQSRW